MRGTFLYPDSGISPHHVHKTWAMSICQTMLKTPLGIGKFDINQIPESDVIVIESLYCLPFAKKYKKLHPNCKIISIIADTSFWKEKLTIARKLFYRLNLSSVDAFITVSERIKGDIQNHIDKPVIVVRPFLVNRYSTRKKQFTKNVLFIGNDALEKGFLTAIKAVKNLPDFNLYLIGTCYKKISATEIKNIHVEGKVPALRKYFDLCSYYIHPAEFDPSPVTIWEAMYAGLIPIISKHVGQCELFTGILKQLILEDTEPKTIVAKLMEIDKLTPKEKTNMTKACKKLASNFIETKSVPEFKKAVNNVIRSTIQ